MNAFNLAQLKSCEKKYMLQRKYRCKYKYKYRYIYKCWYRSRYQKDTIITVIISIGLSKCRSDLNAQPVSFNSSDHIYSLSMVQPSQGFFNLQSFKTRFFCHKDPDHQTLTQYNFLLTFLTIENSPSLLVANVGSKLLVKL